MQIDRLSDHGLHIVYAVMTEEFLTFGKQAGNDLSTPMQLVNFQGYFHIEISETLSFSSCLGKKLMHHATGNIR